MIARFRKSTFTGKISRNNREIDPDEVLLDASNLPDFDPNRFEGRLERPLHKSGPWVILFICILLLIVFVGKVYMLQVVQGQFFADKSENNRLRHDVIFAERGLITDRLGTRLVWNEPRIGEVFPKRVYTETEGFGQLLGFVSYPKKDTSGFYYQDFFEGKDGVEELYNTELNGINGIRLTETTATGKVESESTIEPPQNGVKLVLSIDARLQKIFYDEIKKMAEEHKYTGGSGALMDIETGELLVLTNYPEYDSNKVSEGDREAVASYGSDSRKPYLNRAVAGLYVPGSIVKPFVALGALTENTINPLKKILSTGKIEIQNPYKKDEKTVFRDWKAHGWVDMRDAIAVSSDVYFYAVGGGFEDQKGLGIKNIDKYLALFGFGSLTGFNLSTEKEGNIPTPEWKAENFNGEIWRVGDTYHTSIGQYGMLVTPLQVVRAYAAIANNGKLLVPRLTSLVPNEKLQFTQLAVSPEYLTIVHEGMRQAVTQGTAIGLNTKRVEISGKTGTAELGITKNFVNSWTTGYFPYKNPQYAYVILMERGSRNNTVGATAVMRAVIEMMIKQTPEYLGIASSVSTTTLDLETVSPESVGAGLNIER